jgi:hypothetical protein
MGIMLLACLIWVVVVIAVGKLTGSAVFIDTYASGLIRWFVGSCCAVTTSLILAHDLNTCGRLCPYELSAGAFFASTALACMLIPVGCIQLCGTLLTRLVIRRASPRVRPSSACSPP